MCANILRIFGESSGEIQNKRRKIGGTEAPLFSDKMIF
jgi:hypothetical protein